MTEDRKSYSFIGNDCPPGYRRVGRIDVADPADVHSAQDKGYRIGTIYDGYSGSCAEPCAADIYERPDEEELTATCERCQGNGEIVIDWERYRHPRAGDAGDEAVAECPDCGGEGIIDVSPAPQTKTMGEAWAAKATVLRARGKNNTLHDINQAADYLEAAAAMVGASPERKP